MNAYIKNILLLTTLIIAVGCTKTPITETANTVTNTTYVQQSVTTNTPNYTVPTAADVTALAEELTATTVIADVDLATASPAKLISLYNELVRQQTNATIYPGEIVVELNPEFTQVEVIAQLEQAGFLIKPNSGTNHGTVQINAIGDLKKTTAEADFSDTNDQLVKQVITQLENSNLLTCTNTLQLNYETLVTCDFDDVRQSDITTLLESANVTDSSVRYTQPLTILVPLHEEEAWAKNLTTWEEINQAEVSYVTQAL